MEIVRFEKLDGGCGSAAATGLGIYRKHAKKMQRIVIALGFCFLFFVVNCGVEAYDGRVSSCLSDGQ